MQKPNTAANPMVPGNASQKGKSNRIVRSAEMYPPKAKKAGRPKAVCPAKPKITFSPKALKPKMRHITKMCRPYVAVTTAGSKTAAASKRVYAKNRECCMD